MAVADVGIRGWQGAWPIDITRRLPHVALLAVVASAPALAAAKLSQWAVIAVALVGSTLLAGAIALGFANSPLTEDFSSLHRLLWWGVLVRSCSSCSSRSKGWPPGEPALDCRYCSRRARQRAPG